MVNSSKNKQKINEEDVKKKLSCTKPVKLNLLN